MKRTYPFIAGLAMLAFAALAYRSLPVNARTAPALASSCVASSRSPRTYLAKICITAPAATSTLTGRTTISATVTVTGKSPGVQHVAFYLNGTPVLEDFTAPYTFVLPAYRWVDGAYSLSAEALMRDQYTTTRANIPVTLHTGTTSPPVNWSQFYPALGTAPARGQPVTLGVVGDGAGGDPTAAMVANLIASWNPNLFFYLGDVYERGTIAEFYNWYNDPSLFGRFRAITDPTVGNHEYILGNDSAYVYSWNNIPDYYSFNTGGWHFVSLDSNSVRSLGKTTSAEYLWLQADLAHDTSKCTAVYYHHPFVSIGKEGGRRDLAAVWQLMAQHHVTLVLNGHDHEYQRWVALNGSGQPNSAGITEFIVGTGGHSLTPFVRRDSRVAFSIQKTFGALRLQLYPTFANFSFQGVTGTPIDSGTVSCKG